MKNILTVILMSAGLLYADYANANCWNDEYISLGRMRACYETGADVNSPSFSYRSMLLRVAHGLRAGIKIKPGILEFLVREAGANVNLTDKKGRTALHLVKSFEHVELLINGGADVNAKSNDGWPVIVGIESLDALQALIKADLAVNAKVGDGRETVLGVFVLYHGFPFVDALIKGGADVNLLSDKNPPLCLISYRDQWRGEHAEIANSLIEAGADKDTNCPKTKMSHGDTPLMTAAADGQLDVVRVLLATGADVNLLDDRALRYACQKYHTSGLSENDKISYGGIIGMLVTAGARGHCKL